MLRRTLAALQAVSEAHDLVLDVLVCIQDDWRRATDLGSREIASHGKSIESNRFRSQLLKPQGAMAGRFCDSVV